MGNLKEDIDKSSDWIIKAFKADRLNLDYTIRSFIEIDKFFIKHSSDGKPKEGGRLSNGFGKVVFSIGSYIGNTIVNNVPGTIWETDDEDSDGELTISLRLPGDIIVWPVQRVMKRFKNGIEDSIYVYGYELSKEFTNDKFDENYWKITQPKAWWKLW